MIVGPTKALFMDEISTGLDSSTTFQIVTCLQKLTHITESSILVSLLQPAPETFDLFGDIILMAEGKIAYHGPRDNALEFLEHCGFRCSPRKGIADFLQEVLSKKDQAQYWYPKDQPFSYVSVDKFESIFKELDFMWEGNKLRSSLSLSIKLVLKKCFLVVIALVTMTVFKRTQMTVDMVHSNYYMGSLFYSAIRLMTNGLAELPLTGSRLPILYKQRDLYFYPAWSYTVPAAILKIPFSFLDAVLWTALTYYAISYSPEPESFASPFYCFCCTRSICCSIFQCLYFASNVSIWRFHNFEPSLPAWLEWGFWISPLTYTQIGASLNEFHAPRWEKVSSSNATMGQQFLRSHAPGRSQTTISHQRVSKLKGEDSTNMTHGQELPHVGTSNDVSERKKKGIVLPFEPIAISFENVQDYVDTPKVASLSIESVFS
ncbi:hypothetical protein VitviT2T_009684 [Vitis vinifera]|uniref:ABC-2 type transporter transmembrane domain-containing protein n=1 Tax=Vitis vinifera TaxID=29760 RepID=A0ABY9C755_VITVI|nr:hypothetical protein VitviT2T_009684 [Vitis vinifera]